MTTALTSGPAAPRRAAWLAPALTLLLAAVPAGAADVVVKPAAGSGFVVSGQGGGERLRVNEAGPVFLPGVPSASNQEDAVLCYDTSTGQLGPCSAAVLQSFVGPEGPEGPEGPQGPDGPEGPEGPEGPAGTAEIGAGSGSAYNGEIDVACGDSIPFASSNLGSDVSLSMDTTQLIVADAGRYLISYHLHGITPNQIKTDVEISSTAAPALSVDFQAGTNLSYNASSIVTLAAADTIELTTTCTVGSTVRVRPGAGASLTVVRVE